MLSVVLPAKREHLHSLMDNLIPVSSDSDMVEVVKIGWQPADATLLVHQASIHIAPYIVHKIEQGKATRDIPVKNELN